MSCQCQAPQYCGYCRPVSCAPIRTCNAPTVSAAGTVGPKGDRGPQGFQGIQGPPGPTGPAGDASGAFSWRNNGDGTWDLLIDGVAISGGPLPILINP